ncbi:MAG TPA: type II toxin-antitoxin system HicB family antitoxin [Thermomicrobiales bacterium]|nr:type II toxin-antitoxin system HicB family antitoxin [Thermomicrobiales bacterium]
MKDYHINVFFSDEDACWIADIPDLRFCSAHGETLEQAVAEVQIAKHAWLEAAAEMGDSAPSPTYRPALHTGS